MNIRKVINVLIFMTVFQKGVLTSDTGCLKDTRLELYSSAPCHKLGSIFISAGRDHYTIVKASRFLMMVHYNMQKCPFGLHPSSKL
jgi:hypothetical protein